MSVAFSGLGIPRAARCESLNVAVLYPDIREPYRSVFLEIVKGIDDRFEKPVKQYVLKEDYDLSELKDWLNREQIQVVIALGTRGLMAARALPDAFHVIVGAVLMIPVQDASRFSGIVLTPAPEVLFDQLKKLAPKVQRVTVIDNPKSNGWLIERARAAAARHGLTLNTLPARNLREAATVYRDVLKKQATEKDAIWLLQDATIMDDSTILPFILEQAWQRDLVVFSSNPAHVRRGVLFSLYPDNFRMGRSLAEMALNQVRGNEANMEKGFLPLKDLLIAVNRRTAEHLGLNLTGREQREFDLIFPSQ